MQHECLTSCPADSNAGEGCVGGPRRTAVDAGAPEACLVDQGIRANLPHPSQHTTVCARRYIGASANAVFGCGRESPRAALLSLLCGLVTPAAR